MRPLDQIGLVRKLEVVHKQVGGCTQASWRFYDFKAVNKMEVIWTIKRLCGHILQMLCG